MVVDMNTMYDIEHQILHDANNLFFIRVVALDWTEGFWSIFRILSLAHRAIPSRGMRFLELGQPSKDSSTLASYDLKDQVLINESCAFRRRTD